MSETHYLLSPIDGHDALAEAARSLGVTLRNAPAQESKRATALRSWLIQVAETLAAACEQSDFSAAQARAFTQLLSRLRGLAAELGIGAPPIPPGIVIVLQSFLERLFPQGFLLFRPGQDVYYGEECLTPLLEEIDRAGLHVPATPNLPAQVFIFHYPPGEQDNVLACGVLLRNLYQTLFPQAPAPLSLGLAAWALGPAYFFSLIAMTEGVAGGDPAQYRLGVFTSRALEAAGWFEHPLLGPVLETLSERYEILPNAIDPLAQPLWEELTAQVTPYLPEDFDRDVPLLWDRLRQLLPPNDLDMDAVESQRPADLISILNAGWSFYLLHMDDLYNVLGSKTAQDRFEARQALNRLLTKAVELSQIAQRWSDARKAIEP